VLKVEGHAMEKLIAWKNNKERKPLVIMGARQVGKTWLMKEFGKRYYKKVAYISFYNNSSMSRVFEQDYDVNRIIAAINIEVGFTVTKEDTLIIFDEIQNAPKAFESLKYFNESAPEYQIIVAGSLLGVALHEGISYPVGKVTTLSLYPLNFREYLGAVGEDGLVDALNSKDYGLIDSFSDKYIYHLRNYMYVGGMPEAVKVFLKKNDYYAARDIQNEIILQYKGDFGKHISENELARINMVWESIPMQLAKENKKFFFGKIKKGARSAEFEKAIQWLVDSGLVYRVYKVNEPHVPLSAYKELSFFKLFFVDIGLLGAMSELDLHSIIDGNRLFVEFKAAFTEQYVLQQIISDTEYSPYYYGTDSSTFEQDFLIQKGMDAVPIEVKAETNIRSQSLRAFYDKFHPAISIRFSLLNYKEQEWMTNIPLYAICNL
jgi:predicted AAA+ superfamily ATPase